jgi:hypothetical protein
MGAPTSKRGVVTQRQFVVWIPTPDGYAHAAALTELAAAVDRGLTRLGHESSVSMLPCVPALATGARTIVVGPHHLALLPPLELPDGAILYNTEAFGTPPFANAVPHLIAHPDQVWDISAYNVERMRGEYHGVAAHFVPPGSDDRAFESCAEAEQDIDVLFYGSINDRRRRTLDALRAAGLRVHEFRIPYGRGRDEFIRRAKVVLNLHFYEDPGIFESVRVSHLLNNGGLVVSEEGVGQFPYDQAAVCVPYADLVDVCRDYVQKGAELRAGRAALGPIVMRQFLDTPTLLSPALAALEAGAGSSSAAKPAPTQGPTLCLVVLGKDTDAFAAMDFHERAWREADELVLLKTKDARFGGLSEIANRVAARTRCDVVGFVHADTTFGPGALTTFARTAHGRTVTGLVGITLSREYVWSKDVPEKIVRHVSTLDGCSVFFPVSLLKEGVAFDERFASFHCGVEDFCLSAHAARVETVVPAAQADHYSEARGTFRQPQWQEAYWKDRKVLSDKWAGTRFETT